MTRDESTGAGSKAAGLRMKYYTVLYFLLALVVMVLFISGLRGLMAQCHDDSVLAETTLSMGPLTVNPANPRYFTDGTGSAVYLTGSHTWSSFQKVTSLPLNYNSYLKFLKKNNHNFFRLWAWEQAEGISTVPGKVRFKPLPYKRSGSEKALDGKKKFDLSRFNEAYFRRLRSRILAARKRGIYVGVMLFNGFSIEMKGDVGENPWIAHPFHVQNNMNGIDGDPQGRGDGRDVHTLNIPAITAIQEMYVRKVIDTLNDLDNVLWEIVNESHAESTSWQYHMINLIHAYESTKAKKHPVLMTVQYPGGSNLTLFNSPADAVSPNSGDGYASNPPAADGRKVIISDTDHLWGIGGDYKWVWKTFLMGMHPIFMDPYQKDLYAAELPEDVRLLIRKNMGYTLAYAKRMNLVNMVPRPDLASSGYCLAEEGQEYLIYSENGGVAVDLSSAKGQLTVEWLNPLTGTLTAGGTIPGGESRFFSAPFNDDAVLYLKSNELSK